VALNIVSLLNSSAGGEAFIHYKLLPIIKQQLQLKLYKIKGQGVAVSSYNNQQTDTIRQLFKANLVIDG
jgi:hypothetical protein